MHYETVIICGSLLLFESFKIQIKSVLSHLGLRQRRPKFLYVYMYRVNVLADIVAAAVILSSLHGILCGYIFSRNKDI